MNFVKKLGKQNIALAALAAACLFLLYDRQRGRDVDHGSFPHDEVVEASHDALAALAGEYAAMRSAMADAMRRGKINTDAERREWYEQQLTPAFERAFEDFGQLQHRLVDRRDEDDEFDVKTAIAFDEAAAEGFGMVK